MAFVGLGLTFWGAVLSLTRNGRYVETRLLDGAAHSTYATIDRVLNQQGGANHAYYLPAYPGNVSMPEYMKNLKDPTVYIAEGYDGKPSLDDLSEGRFFSSKKSGGFYICSPGSGILDAVERILKVDLTKVSPSDLCDVLPKCLTETLNLAKDAQLTLNAQGAHFKATGMPYDSLYVDSKPRSVSVLGCPVVGAVASALAKSSGKIVLVGEQMTFAQNTVSVQLNFV